MKTKEKTIKGKNGQQCLFIQALFGLVQTVPIRISVKEKYENIPCVIEVLPCGSFLNYRVINAKGEAGLWNSWESPEEIEKAFKQWSLL